jgi:predicted ATPase
VLERIQLRNFKSAREIALPLAPLSVLAGLNGSGKSTILQILSALRQTYSIARPTGLALGGLLVQLGQGGDILSENASDDIVGISLTEGGKLYQWNCACVEDENHLRFDQQPDEAPLFLASPNFQYLQADRIVPKTLYPQASQQARDHGFLGAHGEYTADFLALRQDLEVAEGRCYPAAEKLTDATIAAKVVPTRKLLDQVAGWFQELSPGVRLRAERVKGTDEVILQFNYVGRARGLDTGSYRPTNVGFGLTYCLPIVAACLAAPPDSLLLIENPEAHLHPQGQVAMGELLSLCAADGAQVIVETHSDHILNGIRVSVKKRRIRPEDVQLHYFTRNMTSGDSTVESPAILPDGQLTNWPEGFFDQWEKSLDELLE